VEPGHSPMITALPAATTQPARPGAAAFVQARKNTRRRWPASPATTIVVALACVLSVAAYLHFYPGGQAIAYDDARSHMLIARRVLMADTPGAGQLGAVWLPLPHILMLAFIWNNWAFYSGFAGSVVMMACYVAGTLFAYKIVWRMTRSHAAAAAGAAVFALNPNILYMQSTPMTETLMFTTMLGSVYGLLCWVQTDDSDRFHQVYLFAAGVSALLCALTRYEGWAMGVTLTGVVLYCSFSGLTPLRRLLFTAGLGGGVALAGYAVLHFGVVAGVVALPLLVAVYAAIRRVHSRDEWHATEGQVLAFGILGATGPLTWMAWNLVIFGDPLAFQNGVYAKPSNWVNNGEVAMHHLWIAFRTYEIATLDTATQPIAILGLLALVVYLLRTRLSPESLPVLSLLVMFPMFVVTLYKGQRPLHVYEYYHSFYNVRFGLVMLLPISLVIGFAAGEAGRLVPRRLWAPLRAVPAAAVIAVAVVLAVNGLRTGGIVTLEEPLTSDAAKSSVQAGQAATWLRQHYAGGLMLMESYGNEDVAYSSHVPLQDQVYEGSYRLWTPALEHPGYHSIVWVVMHESAEDQVYAGLHASVVRYGYRLAWTNNDYLIYRWAGTADQLAANARLGDHAATTLGNGS
jgi:hypothetical protein